MVVKRKLEIPVFQEWRMKKLEPFVGIFTMVGILCLIQIMIGNRWNGAHIFFISLSALLIGGGLLKRPLRKCIWRFTETEAERIMFGHCTKISYQEIADALRTKNIKVTMTSFKVPKSRGYIAFHYEVGDAAAQDRVLESYQFLCKKMEALGVGEEKSGTDKASGRTDGSKLVLQKRTEEQQYLDADFYVAVCSSRRRNGIRAVLYCCGSCSRAVYADPNVV